MPKSIAPKIKSNLIVRFARIVITESAAATFTEIVVDTQLSIDRGVIWLIHFIEVSMQATSLDQPAAAASEQVDLQLTRASQSSSIDIDDPDLLFKYSMQRSRGAAIGTDAGPIEHHVVNPHQFFYNPPIAYGGVNLFAGILGSSGSAVVGRIRIGYTLVTVSDREFFRVANAILT